MVKLKNLMNLTILCVLATCWLNSCECETNERVIPGVDEIANEELCLQNLVGLAVGVVQNGEITHLKGYGYADRENKISVTTGTRFRWASISKSITAVAAMQLWEQGKINLNANIRDYVPTYPQKPEGTIIMRHLLTNTSGIGHYSNIPGWYQKSQNYPSNSPYNGTESVEILKDAALLFAPGDDYKYTTFGFMLAGAGIGAAGLTSDNIGFVNWVDQNIAQPAGMTTLQPDYEYAGAVAPNRSKGYEKDCNGQIIEVEGEDVSWKLPGGGFISTIGDLAKFARALMDNTLLQDATKDIMWQRQNTPDGGEGPYGYGFFVANEGTDNHRVSHSGSQDKTRTLMQIYVEEGLAIVLMCNSHYVDNTRIFRRIANELGRNWDINDYSLFEKLECDDEDKCKGNSDNQFAGVWRAGPTDPLVRRMYSFDEFHDEWEFLSDKGYRLQDIETYIHDGSRKWDGIFHKGSGNYALWRGFDSDGFHDKWEEMSEQGLRLIDLETYKVGGERKWAGVFVEGTDAYALWRGFNSDGFHDKWEEMSDQGLRLIDLETYVDGSNRKWAGVFRAGTDGYALWRGFDSQGFHDKWVEMAEQNLRLIDVETYVSGGRKWAGVWRAGSNGYALQRYWDYCGILGKHEDWNSQGLELIDLEIY